MPSKYKILKVKDPGDKGHIETFPFSLPCKIGILGKSQYSGKSTWAFNFFLNPAYNYQKYFEPEDIFIVSNNRLDTKISILQDHLDIPDCNVMPYDEGQLEVLYDQLEDEHESSKKKKHKIIWFSDCAYSGSLKDKQTGVLSKMMMNGRHLLLSVLMDSQKYSLLSTAIRCNLTGLVVFKINQKELDLVASDHSYLEKMSDFFKMFRGCVRDNRDFMIINYSKKELYFNKELDSILDSSE